MKEFTLDNKDRYMFQTFQTEENNGKLYMYIERYKTENTLVAPVLGYTKDFFLVVDIGDEGYLIRPSALPDNKYPDDREFILMLKQAAYDAVKFKLQEIAIEDTNKEEQ